MVTVEQVLEALRSNTHLDDTVKGNLEELIIIFNTKYPNVSLNNLYNLLPGLKIEKSNKFVNQQTHLSKHTCYIYTPLQTLL